MSSIVFVFHQLLEIIRQPNDVELQNSIVQVNPVRVHIPVYNALLVECRNSCGQLSEHGQSVEQAHLGFAKLFPHTDVLRRVCPEHDCADLVQQLYFTNDIQ